MLPIYPMQRTKKSYHSNSGWRKDDEEEERIEEEDEDKRDRIAKYQGKLILQAEELTKGSLPATEWNELWVAKFCLRYNLGREAGQELIDWGKHVRVSAKGINICFTVYHYLR